MKVQTCRLLSPFKTVSISLHKITSNPHITVFLIKSSCTNKSNQVLRSHIEFNKGTSFIFAKIHKDDRQIGISRTSSYTSCEKTRIFSEQYLFIIFI